MENKLTYKQSNSNKQNSNLCGQGRLSPSLSETMLVGIPALSVYFLGGTK